MLPFTKVKFNDNNNVTCLVSCFYLYFIQSVTFVILTVQFAGSKSNNQFWQLPHCFPVHSTIHGIERRVLVVRRLGKSKIRVATNLIKQNLSFPLLNTLIFCGIVKAFYYRLGTYFVMLSIYFDLLKHYQYISEGDSSIFGIRY